MMVGILRLIALLGFFFTLGMTGLMLLTFRQERPIKIFSLFFSLLLSAAVLPIFMLLSGARLNLLLALPILAFGLVVGFVWGQATRLYAKGGQIMGQYSLLFLLGCGGSLALGQLLNLFGSALLASVGLLPLFLSTGTQVGSNANILVRRLTMRPSPEAASHLQLPPRFAKVKRRFSRLQSRYQARELDAAAYNAELQKLVIEDTSGGYWALDAENEAWYWHDGQTWVRRDPPLQAVPLDSSSPAAAGRQRRRWLWVLIGLPLLCTTATLIFLLSTPYGTLAGQSAILLIDPQNGQAYRTRAAAYADLGDHRRAVADYSEAILLLPEETDLLVHRAIHYSALERYQLAITDLDRVELLDPGDCFAVYFRGSMRERSGDTGGARSDYQRVLAFEDATCYAKPEAAQALAQLGETAAQATDPPPATASPPTQTTPSPPSPTLTPQPEATASTPKPLYDNDFETPQEPVMGDLGQVEWEGGELRILVSAPGQSIKAAFRDYVVADFRLHVTARPVRLHPGSSYGVAVRTDAAQAESRGYWFHLREDAHCRVCVELEDGVVTCPTDWLSCPAMPDESNWITIEGIGPALRFTINDVVVAEVEDDTYAHGAMALWVSNDEVTEDTLVAFDDLAVFEP